MGKSRFTHVLLLGALAASAAGCDEQSASEAASSSEPAKTDTAAKGSASAPEKAPAAKRTLRTGDWKVEAPGRGTAYEVSSKDGVVALSFGGNVLEGTAHETGRRYVSKKSKSEYRFDRTDDGLELVTKGKPTWKIGLGDDVITFSAGDTELKLAKAAEGWEAKKGDELLGKVRAEGDSVIVEDADGKTKYTGKDGANAAWGVLMLKDIGQPMRRLIFTELLARGR